MVVAALLAPTALAIPAMADPVQNCKDGACSFTYSTAFFDRYAPVTALDMVRNLPGFTLQDGDGDTRGFGGAAGNILINGERVSAKTEQPSDILARIPAADVEQIVLIRGQAGGLDLQGQTVIANVVRRSGGSSGAWTIGLGIDTPDTVWRPFSEFTYSGGLGPLQFTASVEAREYQGLVEIDERVVLSDGRVVERRDEVFDETGDFFTGALTTTLTLDKTKIGVNAAYEYFSEAGGETSRRAPVDAQAFTLFQGDTDEGEEVEIGADVERPFGEDFSLKLIGLYRADDFRETGSLVRIDLNEQGLIETETVFNSVETETIGRLEADFSGWTGHLIEFSIEGAVNELESSFTLLELENGALVARDVPGARTTVEEERVDVRVSDAFQVRDVSIEAALGAETSTITQTGGFEESRSFSFWKPSLTLSRALNDRTQIRARALREVGQLDFFDFVSATDLGDDELALGNPNLSPETTVTLDTTYEQRFGDIGVVSLTAFHDWIDDVEDVLPLDGALEVPGNIGSGTRSGLRAEATFPLDGLGLAGGRLDTTGRWQNSSVTDPLTGETRALSGEADWQADVELRQDLTRPRLAWGITVFAFDNAPSFGLDEFETSGERIDIDGFIETRIFGDLRIRLSAENLLRDGSARDRRVFAGPRNTAPLAFREIREPSNAREFFIELTGTF